MRTKQYYRNMTIQNKMVVMFLGIIIALLVLILSISNVILYRSNITKIEKSIQSESGIIGMRLGTMYDNLITCVKSTTKGINQVYQDTQIEKLDEISFISIQNNLYTMLDYYKRCFSDTSALVFVDTRYNIISTDTVVLSSREVKELYINRIPPSGPVRHQVFPTDTAHPFTGSLSGASFTVGTRIISMDSGENLGYLFICVEESTITDSFQDRNCYLVDDRDMVVAAREDSLLLKPLDEPDILKAVREKRSGSFRIKRQGIPYLVITEYIPDFNWMLVNEIAIHDIVRDVHMLTVIIILLGIFAGLFGFLAVCILSKQITKPIEELTRTAAIIGTGDLSCRCQISSEDEIGSLGCTFNSMLDRIGQLLDQVRWEQKKKRESELALFQVQIKPHFLYNTLDLIYVCCEMDEGKEGAKIAKALADYYRTCLSGGEEIISIREELNNIRNYLYIQQERYEDIVSFQINVPEELQDFKIVKLTLQPLVENAIYHGLKEKSEMGRIQIDGTANSHGITLTIQDDGVGIPETVLPLLLQKPSNSEPPHFGIRNVHERIQLYFGTEYGLSLASRPGAGTSVSVHIPKLEDYHD